MKRNRQQGLWMTRWLVWLVLPLAVGCGSSQSATTEAENGGAGGSAQGSGGSVDGGSGGSGILDDYTDTDGDTISDQQEGGSQADADKDGTPNYKDDDSDGDGIPDATEAGDDDVKTPPVDSDGDGTPDFLDTDSDNDGLSDAKEAAAGSDPTNTDTDGDGVDDLVEDTAGTSPTDPKDNPESKGDFVFREPYKDKPTPSQSTLVFEPTIKKADVFFVIDTSWSMGSYIKGVRTNLQTRIIPGIGKIIQDVHFGAGEFDRGPSIGPGNSGKCLAIGSDQTSTGNTNAVEAALSKMTPDCGTDEPYAQALWLWAKSDTSHWPKLPKATCQPGEVGYGCARPDAIPIVILIGDEHFCESYRLEAGKGWVPSVQDIIDQYKKIGGRVLAMGPTVKKTNQASSCKGQHWAGYEEIAKGTGAVDSQGNPLVYPDAKGETVANQVVKAVGDLANGGAFRLSARVRDPNPGDGVDVTKFVDHIVPNTAGGVADPRDATRVCVPWNKVADMDKDGMNDHFLDVPGGTPVCFDIYPAENDFVPPKKDVQLFEAVVDVMGDDISVLDSRTVYFIVPPDSASSGGPPVR